MELQTITAWLDRLLDCGSFQDASANGLQVENSGDVHKAALGVDASLETIQKAAAQGCTLLIVHHGLFWGAQQLMLEPFYGRIRALVQADMALYAAHLPLDAHPVLGHNARIAEALGLQKRGPFAFWHGRAIGVKGSLEAPVPREQADTLASEAIGGRQAFFPFGPEKISTIGVVAGSATEQELFRELKLQGIDLFITGEPRHGAQAMARELGLNIFYGGHYRTETFGMKALAAHLQDELALPAVFIDTPCVP